MFGLLGEKLGHSYSKLIHEKLGYSYDLIERAPEELAAFLLDGEFDGLNVTIPYKKTVMEYCHQVSDLAKRIGAVNTIYKEGSRLMGTNTDYEGLRYALGRANISLAGKKVLILGGTGGAGSMASILAADKGAGEILIATRGDKAFHGDRLFVSHSPGQSAKQKACPRETLLSSYSNSKNASTSSSLVAQLVTRRTTLWSGCSSQIWNMTSFSSSAVFSFEKIGNIMLDSGR